MVRQINYKHLRYFFNIAREGSIVKAAEILHVSPQTISGQLTAFEEYLGLNLFDRMGKRLVLNEAGKLAFSYAEDIFSLGEELQQSLNAQDLAQQFVFNVGVIDVIPKILASNILDNSFQLEGAVKLVCREGDFDSLLSEMALNRIDLIISDRPLTPGTPIKAYSHLLGESGLSFYAKQEKIAELEKDFPQSLDRQPFLMCGDKSNQKFNLLSWFDTERITPNIVAEFDDSALMKYFGQSGRGVFSTPSIIEHHVTSQYGVGVIGRTDVIKERFYAISPERKVRHPGVKLLAEAAQRLFSQVSK
ncbi:MAG: LysR family transcriptional activator of nhaA [Pseudohongiellaceae bacterium]|jgi:LysR family transcriptional activator of nhaA